MLQLEESLFGFDELHQTLHCFVAVCKGPFDSMIGEKFLSHFRLLRRRLQSAIAFVELLKEFIGLYFKRFPRWISDDSVESRLLLDGTIGIEKQFGEFQLPAEWA